jgi:hypothetical protein
MKYITKKYLFIIIKYMVYNLIIVIGKNDNKEDKIDSNNIKI